MATAKPKKKTQPYVPSYANGGVQYTGSGATIAGKKSASGTQVLSIKKDGVDVPVNRNIKANEFDNLGITATRSATGINKLKFPDGREFNNLNNEQAQSLINDYKKRPLTTEEAKAKEELLNPVIPPNATPEEIAQLGQINEAPPDQTTASILKNQKTKEMFDAPLGIPVGPIEFFGPTTLTSSGVRILNRIAPGLGTELLNGITENEEVKSFLTKYSNEDNFGKIQTDMKQANINIAVAKDLAKNPERKDEARTLFNEAIAQKRRSLTQLKIISNKDQGAYVSKVKEEMILLQDYLDNGQFVDKDEFNKNLISGEVIGNG